MIKETISNQQFIERFADGGSESILSIIKHYKRNAIMVNFDDFIRKAHAGPHTFNSLKSLANKYGLISVMCKNIDIKTIIEYNQPIIINISSSNIKNDFVVCYGFDIQDGFKIYNPKIGYCFTSVLGLNSMWHDNKCLAFINV